MKRQGLITTVFELRTIADELEAQNELLNLELDVTVNNQDSKFQLNIINKNGLSDTWKFEKSQQIKKDGTFVPTNHLETRSKTEEENTRECKTVDADTQFADNCQQRGVTQIGVASSKSNLGVALRPADNILNSDKIVNTN